MQTCMYFIICVLDVCIHVLYCIYVCVCMCLFLSLSLFPPLCLCVCSINFKIDSSVFGVVGYLPCSFSRAYFIVLNVATYLDYRVALRVLLLLPLPLLLLFYCYFIVGGFISPSTIICQRINTSV